MELLDELSVLPTGIFSVALGLVLLYWVVFLLGGLDIDFLGGADGADGALDGATDGAFEAAGGADGAVEGAAEGAAGMLHALRLRSVPVTVSLSFVTLIAWVASLFSMRLFDAPGGLTKALIFLGASAFGLFGGSLAVRPFGRLFREHRGLRLSSLVGTVVTVTTGRVDERFGQARCDTRANLILEVRSKAQAPIGRGEKVLLVDFDEDTKTFLVEPADPLLHDLQDQSRR